ncbi:unnamed protein product [Thlaspi arvense]|uniref:Uncharacterized protein n=1 Tax=Thlaspi arvense TaxID=13288 RepID=A0AAU9SIP9_THLAR|nr:unnamed protein product [Thlaspi arvense]
MALRFWGFEEHKIIMRLSSELLLSLVPSLTFYHSGLCSNRLKPLEKSDWRAEVLFKILLLDMSSVCGRLDYKDAESHLESSSASSPNNGAKHVSCIGCEDAQESDGDDSGYINQNANKGSKSISESLPRKSLDDEGEDKNLATALQDMFSESKMGVVNIIPAIKGSREKHGKSLEKLSVSWAEDVYDPPPSIVSHTRSKKQQQPKSKSRDSLKKNGKKGQKGSSNSSSSSRGSKDKKQSSSSSSRSKHSRDKFGWATQVPLVAASS